MAKEAKPKHVLLGRVALALCAVCGLFLVWGVINLVIAPLMDTFGFPQDLALGLSPVALLFGWISRKSGKGKAAMVAAVIIAALVLCLPWPSWD